MEQLIMSHIEFVKSRIQSAKENKKNATDSHNIGMYAGMVIAYEMELNDLERMLFAFQKQQHVSEFVYEGAIK